MMKTELQRRNRQGYSWYSAALLLVLLLAACEASAIPLVPTERPTATPTYTPPATDTPGPDATPTREPTRTPAPGEPSPTPLIGRRATSAPLAPTGTPRQVFNPNAPRIEFFTSDVLAAAPGETVTLYWAARGVDSAVIYRLNNQGERTQIFNVSPDDNLEISTRSSDRGQLAFILAIGEGDDYTEQSLVIPLQCPIEWFFQPAPDECPTEEAQEMAITEQPMERGRMLYASGLDRVFVLFNDGEEPAWRSFENRYDPDIHPEREEDAPPEFIQPLRELGLVWRTDNTVRNRLGLGTAEGSTYQGFVQSAPAGDGEALYISSADGSVLQLLPGGESWLLLRP